MHPLPSDVSELISSIYSAPLDHTNWNGVMTKMATMFDGTAAILAFAELQHGPRTTPETKMLRWYDHNAGPENIQAYLAHSNHDLRTAHGLARPGQVYVDHEFISDQEMDKHRFYQEFLKPFDMRYTVGVTARTATDHGIVSNVIRSPRQGPAEEHHIALMGLLHTHVTQAVKIGDRLQRLSLENAALRNAFDYLSDGILIISGDGKVIIANRAADELIKSRDGLMTVSGTLTASHGPTADALRELIAKTARNKLGQSPQTAALPIPKPSGGRSLHLLAMPVVTSMEAHFGFLDDTPSVFLMVTDPDLQPAPPEDRLRVIFGLTGAEARLSAALVTGLSIADYVEETGLTENTVRWTLKQIQAKTDCRRQANLVRLLATTATVIQK